jgi:hypothetical protein
LTEESAKCEQGIGEKLGVGIGLVAATIGLLVIAGCGAFSNKQAIIAFTEQALAIEQQRNERVAAADRIDPSMWSVTIPYYIGYIADLKVKLIALDSPKETQVIKDTLVEVYSQEQSSIRQVYQPPSFGCETRSSLALNRCRGENVWEGFYPYITKDNFGLYGPGVYPWGQAQPWVKAQCLRNRVYNNWLWILKKDGIDTAKFPLLPLETHEQMLLRVYLNLKLEPSDDIKKAALSPPPWPPPDCAN